MPTLKSGFWRKIMGALPRELTHLPDTYHSRDKISTAYITLGVVYNVRWVLNCLATICGEIEEM